MSAPKPVATSRTSGTSAVGDDGADEVGNLRRARLQAGLTLNEFAARMSVSVACASRWETGVRRPHSHDVRRIAPVIGRDRQEVASWFADGPLLETDGLSDARGLRVLRLRAGVSRAGVAQQVGVSVATVAHWECGRRSLPPSRWPALSAALGIAPDEFASRVRQSKYRPSVGPLAMLRRRRGLTQRQLASGLGVSVGMVSQWERGVQVPSWPAVRRLSLLLACPVATVAMAVGREAPEHLDQTHWSAASLGSVLRGVRLWRGESRSTIGARVGVHSQTMRRWESGSTSPSREQLLKLETALGLSRHILPR